MGHRRTKMSGIFGRMPNRRTHRPKIGPTMLYCKSTAMKLNTKLRILEFIVAGVILDLTENVISIKLTTRAELTLQVFLITLAVVVPFAIITEIIIDHPSFWTKVLRIKRK